MDDVTPVSGTPVTNNKRSLRNLFVQPGFQLKLSLFYFLVGGLILGGVGMSIRLKLAKVQALMNSSTELNLLVQNQVNELMLECIQYSLVGFGAFVLLSFVYSLMVSHRIAGPQVAILAYIAALKNRDYGFERDLRSHDELTGIMAALKDLKRSLVERERASG